VPRHGVDLLLTAHHLDDQAETVLLQLLRGSGAGRPVRHGCGQPRTWPARRRATGDGASAAGASARRPGSLCGAGRCRWVEDESNADTRYARNALRHEVMPVLARAFPGFEQRIVRQRPRAVGPAPLDELAAEDLAAALDGDGLDLARLRALSLDRVNNLLRHWFTQRRLAMPTTALLAQMVSQMLTAARMRSRWCRIRNAKCGATATACIWCRSCPSWPACAIRTTSASSRSMRSASAGTGRAASLSRLRRHALFRCGATWLRPAWLRAQALEIDFRKGGEKLKPAANRPTRSLKQWFQATGIPAWERTRLPIVGNGSELLFAAGLGMDCRHLGDGADRVALRWQASH
jgi:tRNA(Ile)-lysidine synthase